MPSAAAKLPDFQGDFRRGVDGSRRVMIPVEWRPRDRKIVFTVLLWPIEEPRYLLVLPPERWQQMLEKVKTMSLHDERNATLLRVLGASSTQLVLDRIGRFRLPEGLAAEAGIEKEVMFVGLVERFEMWSPDRRKADIAKDRKVAASVARENNL